MASTAWPANRPEATGATTIGVLSTAAVAVGSALLVGAEVAARSKR